MELTGDQIRIIEHVINVFETGSPEGDYSDISIFHDGPDDRRQITYGRSQTTEYGHLGALVRAYVGAKGAQESIVNALSPYVGLIGSTPLVDDDHFRFLLQHAAGDPVMHTVQDSFFRKTYLEPAIAWATAHGFQLPLSALVIYDSFVHSGSIRSDIRERFRECPPAQGGDEKIWIEEYVQARRSWLANHRRTILHSTVYRCDCFLHEISRENWRLDKPPVRAHGVDVY